MLDSRREFKDVYSVLCRLSFTLPGKIWRKKLIEDIAPGLILCLIIQRGSSRAKCPSTPPPNVVRVIPEIFRVGLLELIHVAPPLVLPSLILP